MRRCIVTLYTKFLPLHKLSYRAYQTEARLRVQQRTKMLDHPFFLNATDGTFFEKQRNLCYFTLPLKSILIYFYDLV